ncbi:MAG: hypothetical protein ABI693_28205 [Bryobacteraceae bacterium]
MCLACNQKLDKAPGYKSEHATEFRAFQDRLSKLRKPGNLVLAMSEQNRIAV